MLGLLFVVGVLVGPGVAGNIALGKGVDGLKQAVVDVVGGGGGGSAAVGQSAEGDGQQVDVGSRRVKVDLSVMSRCPDAVSAPPCPEYNGKDTKKKSKKKG